MDSDLLTIDEVARRVRLSTWAVRRAISRGELVAYKPGGRLRIPIHAVDAWLASTQVSSTAPRPTADFRPLPAKFPAVGPIGSEGV